MSSERLWTLTGIAGFLWISMCVIYLAHGVTT